MTERAGEGPLWPAVRVETLGHLQRLLRLVTVNPPGNEIVAARYLEEVFHDAGIEVRLLEPAPGRAAVLARLGGNGSRRPVLLVAHMDVVGVTPDEWSVDPFGAVVRDGYLYGRGAIDDKGMLAANLQTMLLIKRWVVDAGDVLQRDVVFLASSDEETGGEWGLGWLIAHHPELLDAEFAINEGGRTRIVGGRPLYLAVQSAEKVSHVVRMVASGAGGHAAVPLADNAVLRLGRALAAIGGHREPLTLGPTTEGFFASLSKVWPDSREGVAMSDLVSGDGERRARAALILATNPVFDAILRNGISPVMLEAGIRHNVIPTEASATLNIRTLPGQSLDDVIARLCRAVDDPQLRFDVVERSAADPPASPVDSSMFSAIAESSRDLDPDLVVVPYLSTGATDSARLRAIGIQSYGILPFPMEQADEQRMHGNDERIPIESLHFGVRLIYGAIRRIAT